MWMFWLFLSLVSMLGFAFTIYFLESWMKPRREALKRGDRARLDALERELEALRDEIGALREQFADVLLALDDRGPAHLAPVDEHDGNDEEAAS